MSRIGNQPIPVADAVNVSISGSEIKVKGPKGELDYTWNGDVISVAFDAEAKEVKVTRADDSKNSRALHGLVRSLINNMVSKKLS